MSDEPRFQDLIECYRTSVPDEDRFKARVCPVCFTSAGDHFKMQFPGSRLSYTYWRCANACTTPTPHGDNVFQTPTFVPTSKVCGTVEDLVAGLRRAHREIAWLTEERDRLRRQVDASHEAFLRRYAPEQSEQAHEVAEAQAAEAADVYAEVDWSALR